MHVTRKSDDGINSVTVRPARADDAAAILGFVRELAAYERLADSVRATETDMMRVLFGETPRAFAEIVDVNGEAVGFALWFYSFSTFEGRHGLYLEDLYVRPQARGVGAGKALLTALARRCRDEGLARMEWAVLDWNAPAIAFYDSLGADVMTDWITRRLTGGALAKLAQG